jgi:hypothetical protein
VASAFEEEVTLFEPDPPPKPARPAAAPARPAPVEEVEIAELVTDEAPLDDVEVVEVVEEAEVVEAEPAPKKKPAGRFSWFAAVLLLVGALAIGIGSALPFLPGPSVSPSPSIKDSKFVNEKPPWIDEGKAQDLYVAGGAAGVAFICLLGLVAAIALRNFGVFSMLTAYLTAFAAVAGLALTGTQMLSTAQKFENMEKAAKGLAAVKKVEANVNPSFGIAPYAALGAGGLALLGSAIALLALHRTLFTRLLAVLLILGAIAGGAVFIGQNADMPSSVSQKIGL